MVIHIQGNDYLILYTISRSQELEQYQCRRVDGPDGHMYRAVRIASSAVFAEMIEYLMDLTHNKSFYDFVDYATTAGAVVILLDCGEGRPLASLLREESIPLPERLQMGKKLLERLLISDFPPYFIHAAMDPGRVKMNAAMDFFFDFDLSDFPDFKGADPVSALRQAADVLEALFLPEVKRKALPDLDRLLYGMRRGEYAELLPVYRKMGAIAGLVRGKEEELESGSFLFRLWDRLKALGRFLLGAGKAAVVLVFAAYLALSIYHFMQPEPEGRVYEQIGDLQIK